MQTDADSGVIREAHAEELADVLDLQKRAFTAVAERVGTMEIAPLTQTMPDIVREFESGIMLVCEHDGRIVGSVRAHVHESVAHVGRSIVDPSWQCRGIGTRLMKALENRVEGCTSYELFTGEEFPEVVRLYEALGYRVTGTVTMDSAPMVMMSKPSAG
ncbi:GNAT family N-acetyltransferase [Propionibacterium australiense]|uniref:Acetyltransferase (GNAT) domain n=1 Tax=Propionibacterium australiense TaxID=119981 RepID=A0A383S4M0_9ACTN|nr:GNAT family N-acetyltransferase [Propionibacterium australiense]RLP10034.1 GNAT family N-acetyltransferase [Propionibacterium australiense]RLP11318.1 GNAT family N-acetyltransferase [Propionibacterium australiense]SYZ32950.1 Acetyltransferase (GNAT) domain [Propionibacterium australiense]VEH92369.1 putative acetyltransferase [Propionibacterium australiense]